MQRKGNSEVEPCSSAHAKILCYQNITSSE